MAAQNLVDGLDIRGELLIKGTCKDCIYSKQTAQPFYENTVRGTKVLEWIYIDIQGPASIWSAGRANYFMLLTDRFSSYQMIAFFSTKSLDTTLVVLKAYQVEAEYQTERKLKYVRIDIGKEQFNLLWDDFQKSQELIFEFTTPYAHQQNGVVEQAM